MSRRKLKWTQTRWDSFGEDILCVAFTSDSTLASLSCHTAIHGPRTHTLRMWDVDTGTLVGKFSVGRFSSMIGSPYHHLALCLGHHELTGITSPLTACDPKHDSAFPISEYAPACTFMPGGLSVVVGTATGIETQGRDVTFWPGSTSIQGVICVTYLTCGVRLGKHSSLHVSRRSSEILIFLCSPIQTQGMTPVSLCILPCASLIQLNITRLI